MSDTQALLTRISEQGWDVVRTIPGAINTRYEFRFAGGDLGAKYDEYNVLAEPELEAWAADLEWAAEFRASQKARRI